MAAASTIALVAAAITSGVWWRLTPVQPSPTVTRFALPLAPDQQFTGRQVVAMSPDGTRIAYGANRRLWLRSMYDREARPIQGLELAANPVFSPDGGSIAFYEPSGTRGTLKKIRLDGGAPVTLAQIGNPQGISWDDDGLLIGQGPNGILRVPENGGKPITVMKAADGEFATSPMKLPGGDAILVTIRSRLESVDRPDEVVRVVAYSTRSGTSTTLLEGGSDARYLATGHLVYTIRGVLFAVRFDARRLKILDGPVPVLEGVRRNYQGDAAAQFATASRAGSLVYLPGPASASTDYAAVLTDRRGKLERLGLQPDSYEHPRVAPDNHFIALSSGDDKTANIWVYALAGTEGRRRLTNGGRNRFPIWSNDSRWVAFQSDREGDLAIYRQRADGSGEAERLTKPEKDTAHVPDAWAPNGENFLYDVVKGFKRTLYVYSLGEKKATPFGEVESNFPTGASFSPSGDWVTYRTRTGTTTSVYVRPFFPTGPPQFVAESAIHPAWSADGKELFVEPQGGFVSFAVTTKPAFALGRRETLTAIFLNVGPQGERDYDPTPDGRFVGLVPSNQDGLSASVDRSDRFAPDRIEVVLNWFEELKQRVPTK